MEKNAGMGMLALIAAYDMIPPGSTVLCAVSGGADSICLLHRLFELRERYQFTLVAAHYNHGLRGAEAQRDEDFVRAFVARWCAPVPAQGGEALPAVEVVVGRGDVAGEAKKRGRGVEETARAMRYAFLRETAEGLGCHRIATAHSADDNAETLLLHLARGTGLQGLAGIAPRRGNLVRPLLTTTRAEIEDYLRQRDLPHVEDSSNADDAYSRNKMRHQVIPLLNEINPGFAQRMIATAGYLRADNDYMNAAAERACMAAHWVGDDLVIGAGELAGLPAALAPRVARTLLARRTKGDTDCSARHLDAIVALAQSRDPSALCHLPGGLVAQRVYGDLVLTTQRAEEPFPPFPLQVGENPVAGGRWTVIAQGAVAGLTVRPRNIGDTLHLPNRGRRTVKKLMIDMKIPRHLRQQIPVVADEAGVLAVAALGADCDHPLAGRVTLTFLHTERPDL